MEQVGVEVYQPDDIHHTEAVPHSWLEPVADLEYVRTEWVPTAYERVVEHPSEAYSVPHEYFVEQAPVAVPHTEWMAQEPLGVEHVEWV